MRPRYPTGKAVMPAELLFGDGADAARGAAASALVTTSKDPTILDAVADEPGALTALAGEPVRTMNPGHAAGCGPRDMERGVRISPPCFRRSPVPFSRRDFR
jgi:hypothetical protein